MAPQFYISAINFVAMFILSLLEHLSIGLLFPGAD